MNELAEANQAYGALTEGLYLASFTFERAMGRALHLLKTGQWKGVGGGFEDVNTFVRSLKLHRFGSIAEQRREFVEAVPGKGALPFCGHGAILSSIEIYSTGGGVAEEWKWIRSN